MELNLLALIFFAILYAPWATERAFIFQMTSTPNESEIENAPGSRFFLEKTSARALWGTKQFKS